jgi:aromatic-L-amino-acid decarboxylase
VLSAVALLAVASSEAAMPGVEADRIAGMARLDLERLRALEAASANLDPDLDMRTRLLGEIDRHAQRWLEGVADLPGYSADSNEAMEILAALPIPDLPRPVDEILEALASGVDAVGVNESSPNFFGFIPGGALYSGAVADYQAAVANRYSGMFYSGPGAVRVGRICLEWLAGLLGYPEDCGGDVTSGGSIANLIAIVAAREHHRIGPDGIRRAVVYMTDQTHHSVEKALRIAGLSQAPIRRVPLDAGYRLRAEELERLVADDRAHGLAPFLVVASAGSTDTGAVDPLDEIARVCEGGAIWFHVDAAYGGAFALADDGARLLRGIERSDSLVVDPHKGFFLPFGTGAVLVRDRRALVGAFSGSGAYIEDAMSSEPDTVLSPAEMSPELTRPFRALRWWFALQLHGVAAFRAALEEKLILTRHAHARISELDGFEVGPAPDLTVFTFRHVAGDDPDDFNRRLLEELIDDGRIFLSATTLAGRYTLRFAVLGFRTHLRHVDRAVDVIESIAGRLVRSSPREEVLE